MPGMSPAGGRRRRMGSAGACSESPGSTAWSAAPRIWTGFRPSSTAGSASSSRSPRARESSARSVGQADDRGLTDLGRAFLGRIAELATGRTRGPDSGPRPRRHEHAVGRGYAALARSGPGGTRTATAGFDQRRGTANAASSTESSPEFATFGSSGSRGGVIGLTPGMPGCETPDELKSLVELIAAHPVRGSRTDRRHRHRQRPTGPGATPGGPGIRARGISRWFERTFDRTTAAAIVAGNARRLLLRSAGVPE